SRYLHRVPNGIVRDAAKTFLSPIFEYQGNCFRETRLGLVNSASLTVRTGNFRAEGNVPVAVLLYDRCKLVFHCPTQLSIQDSEGSDALRALPRHRRFQPLEVFLFLDRPYDAEADEVGVGHPPDALGRLWIALEPVLVRAHARGGAALVGRVDP